MIGTDEMSSTGMDISESFRPEDISKTDFFDFVTAPDMGIGLGVNVNLHHSHHHNHNHHHHHHSATHHTMTQHHHNNNNHQHHTSQHQQHQQQQQQQRQHNTDRTSMTHDGGGGGGGGGGSIANSGDSHGDASGLSDGSSASTTDPTLHGYEFWTSDKEHTSTIFEDLDRYCWQQQSNSTSATNNSSTSALHHSSPATTLNPLHSASVNPVSPHNLHSPVTPVTTTTPSSLSSTPVPQTQLNSDGTISNIISTDGQIYTLTVLNGTEPWLKQRDSEPNLNSGLDLDSLLGTFPGYIKSEYPYDDSGFSTDGCKDVVNGDAANVMNSSSGIAINQRLPSLINTLAVASSGPGGAATNDSVSSALSIGQQLDQFHNNNNDWHMTDHNNEQNSAESLLRSALQGKGYAKGLHMHSGITLMPTSPTVKDDDMRRILFPVDTDGLNFSDTSMSAVQIFDDTQNPNGHNSHMVVPHSPVTNGPLTPVTNPNVSNANNSANQSTTSLIVDDMFLTLENAFSDDFEKIKQFCTTGGGTADTNDYTTNDVMMQIAANGSGGVASATTTGTTIQQQQQQQQQLQTLQAISTTTPNTPNSVCGQTTMTTIHTHQQQLQQQQQQPPPQPLKPEVTTSTQRIVSTAKVTKKYKRSLSNTHHNNNNNNNNNTNVINHNTNTSSNKGSSNNLSLANGNNRNSNNSSSGSSTNSNNSPPHCNGSVGVAGVTNTTTTSSTSASSSTSTSTSSSATATATAQRKERSLHYCSICSKGFKDKYSVNVHIRTHTGEKPFACTLCGKSFRQKAHLAKHYQTHMAQKNNGNLVKGNSNKHHRSSSSSQNLSSASPLTGNNHQRPLRLTTSASSLSPMSLNSSNVNSSLVSGLLTQGGLPALGVTVVASSAPSTPTTILPPANGLLANR